MNKKSFLAVVNGLVLAMATYNAVAFTCTTAITGETIIGDMDVPAGATCSPTDVTVIGVVTVGADANLEACNSTFTGGVRAVGSHDIHLGEVTGDPVCPGNTIIGDVTIQDGTEAAELDSNRILGSVTLTNNAFIEIESNFITGSLRCSGNSDFANNGFTNTVLGPKTGQCAGL